MLLHNSAATGLFGNNLQLVFLSGLTYLKDDDDAKHDKKATSLICRDHRNRRESIYSKRQVEL